MRNKLISLSLYVGIIIMATVSGVAGIIICSSFIDSVLSAALIAMIFAIAIIVIYVYLINHTWRYKR